MTARPIVPGSGHGAVLAAVRTLLADGKAYSAEELCAVGIEHKLLPPSTIPNYVRNAIKTLLDRQRDRAEKPGSRCCATAATGSTRPSMPSPATPTLRRAILRSRR